MLKWNEVKEELKSYYIDLKKIYDLGYNRFNVYLNYDSFLNGEKNFATIYEFDNGNHFEYEIHYG